MRFSSRQKNTGFSLLEMAVVLLIVSLLMGGLLMSLSTTQELNNRTDVEMELEEMMEALYGYAQANGRLPCPATATSNGAEAPAGGGNCTQDYGFVPSSTLGLSGPVNDDGLLMDEWLSPYRYSVSDANGSALTTTGGMRAIGIDLLTPDLQVCDAAACGTTIANQLPVVIMSLGADWANFTSADEVENSGEQTVNGYRLPNDDDFVVSTFIEDSFDDLLVWMSPNILYTRMISAGQLP